MLPWQVHVLDGPPRKAELGVGQGHEPRPAIGLLRSAYAWRGPIKRLLAETVGMLQVESVHVGSPDHRQVRLARSAPPEPQALGDARLARQALDLHQHRGAAHGDFRAVAALGWMSVRLGVHASPGAYPYRAILRVFLALLARGCPPGALVGAGELLAVPLWPPNLGTDRWRRIGIETAVAP